MYYTADHLWILELAKTNYRVGISDFAQSELGDIVYVKLPRIGEKYAQDAVCLCIESVKSSSTIQMPASGRISQINNQLSHSPEFINNSPCDKGWLFEMETAAPLNLEQLLDEGAYLKQIEN